MAGLCSHPLRPAADGGDAGARDLDQAELGHDPDEALDSVVGPVISNTKCSVEASITWAR